MTGGRVADRLRGLIGNPFFVVVREVVAWLVPLKVPRHLRA